MTRVRERSIAILSQDTVASRAARDGCVREGIVPRAIITTLHELDVKFKFIFNAVNCVCGSSPDRAILHAIQQEIHERYTERLKSR